MNDRETDIKHALLLVELFTRAALDNKGLGDRQCIEAVHDLVAPLVPEPIGYDQIALVDTAVLGPREPTKEGT